MILEGVVVLVFGLPAGSTRRHDRRHTLVGEAMIGDEGVVVHLCLHVFTDDDDFAPIHKEDIGAVAQEHIIDKAVGPALPVPTVPVCGDNLTDEIELNSSVGN